MTLREGNFILGRSFASTLLSWPHETYWLKRSLSCSGPR